MTVNECLTRVRATPGCSADEEMMLTWLSDVEGILFEEVLSGREGAPERFDGYGDEDSDTVLFAKDPYSMLYVYYVVAQSYLHVLDLDRYNTYLALYRDAFDEFAGYHARHHRQTGNVEVKL